MFRHTDYVVLLVELLKQIAMSKYVDSHLIKEIEIERN